MSKKISLLIPNKIKPNLGILFHEYLNRVGDDIGDSSDDVYSHQLALLGLIYGYDEDEDDDVVFPFNRSESKRRNHSGKKKDVYEEFWENVDDYEGAYGNKSKRKHRHNKSSKKKFSGIDIHEPYSGWEDDWLDDESNSDYDYDTDNGEVVANQNMRWDDNLVIWFYPIYNNKNNRIEFNSLKEFDDFCGEHGYTVSKETAEDIVYRPISHVCLYPSLKEYGTYEICACESYADMVFEAVSVDA